VLFRSQILEEASGEKGFEINWNALVTEASYVRQLFFGIFIGSKFDEDISLIFPSRELFEKHEIFIEVIDGGMWEIFTKDELLYNRLISKYKISEFLETDFEQHIYNE
jgi:hypothetical protein